MAAILGDLLQIVDYQIFLGQQVLNVFYYRVTNITGLSLSNYDDMLTWFQADIVEQYRAEQASALVHTYLELRNLSNNVDIVTKVINQTGGRSVAAAALAPSYVSLGFKLVRESLVTRNGYKRFAGLGDDRIEGNAYVFGAGTQALIEAALAVDWVDGAITMAEPVIVKRPIVPPVGTAYLYASIGSAIYTQLGSQNTRKAGRGT